MTYRHSYQYNLGLVEFETNIYLCYILTDPRRYPAPPQVRHRGPPVQVRSRRSLPSARTFLREDVAGLQSDGEPRMNERHWNLLEYFKDYVFL